MTRKYPCLRMLMITAAAVLLLGRTFEADTSSARPSERSSPPGTLRVISYNIRYFEPPARTEASKERLARVQKHGQVARRMAMEIRLYEPDILSIQEATPKEMVAELAGELGMNHVFFPSNWSDDNWPHGIPGALLTRFEIVESQNRPLVSTTECPEDIFTRHFGRAVIATDTGKLVVFSAHLLPGNRETSVDVHKREISEILAVVDKDRKAGCSVLLLGDLNHRPDGFEYKMWIGSGLTDTYASLRPEGTSTVSGHPSRRRIDYIWAAGPIAERLSSCRFLYEGAFRTNPDDSGSFALSDHTPVLAVFK